MEWISAAEGQKFKRVMTELHDMLHRVTVEEVEQTKRILAEEARKSEQKARKKKSRTVDVGAGVG